MFYTFRHKKTGEEIVENRPIGQTEPPKGYERVWDGHIISQPGGKCG